jgi:uncharacterized membrane protein YgdD (TMEM256/DUF423 family)
MQVWLFIAAINGFLAVALGAFGSHGLEGRLSSKDLTTFETAVRYHMYHALALGLCAIASQGAATEQVTAAGSLFTLGIVLFSGSLYLYSVRHWRPLVYLTPLGGLAFLSGWVMLAWAACKLS